MNDKGTRELIVTLLLYLGAIFALIFFIGIALYKATTPASAAQGVDTAIVFLVDVSDSMEPDEVEIARQSHALAITSAEVLEAIVDGDAGRIAVAYVEFSTKPVTVVGWTLIDGAPAARAFAEVVLAGGEPTNDIVGATGLGEALLEADALLETIPYVAPRLVVDIVGDGRSNSGPDPSLGREAILSRGAVINTMALVRRPQNADVEAYFAQVIAGGPGHFAMPITSVGQMPMALRSKIVLELY